MIRSRWRRMQVFPVSEGLAGTNDGTHYGLDTHYNISMRRAIVQKAALMPAAGFRATGHFVTPCV